MIDSASIEWSATNYGDGKFQYRSITPLDMHTANHFQGLVVTKLGTSRSADEPNHKTFPCSVGVAGVENGERNWCLSIIATPEQFGLVFPDARVIAETPKPNIAAL